MALTSKELAQEQLEEIANQPRKAKVAKPVQPDKRAGRSFNSQLQKLVSQIRKDIKELIVPLIRKLEPQFIGDAAVNDGWASEILAAFNTLNERWSSVGLSGAARQTAFSFVSSMNNQNRKRFSKSVKSVGIDVFGDSPKLQDILEASIADNTRLIKTIPQQYLNQVESIVVGNMRAGLKPSAIVKQLQEQFGVTKRRAALIARDQTTKANGELSKQRQEDSGFEFFRWQTAEDSRVRDDHDDISDVDVGFGKGVYRWDDPPKNKKGVAIIPGQEVNCRCIAVAVTTRQVNEYRKSKGLPLIGRQPLAA